MNLKDSQLSVRINNVFCIFRHFKFKISLWNRKPKNSQRLTCDTFWRTFWRKFYAVLTTRSRIRNDWHMIHFGGHFTPFSQRGKEFATMNFNRTAIMTTHRFWYQFNIFLTSDYTKRWWDLYITPSTEYWNCKVGFGFSSWMLVVQLACCSISRMLRAQFSRTSNHVKCWEFKLNY